MLDKKNQDRTIGDIFISSKDALFFSIYESARLRLSRVVNERQYLTADKPLVSVCVPTYNRGEILVDRAIPSVLSQTYKNIELIIVGDHCTDNTESLVSKINDPRIQFINLPSRQRKYRQTIENHWYVGGSIPANYAMSIASGKWIARIDDDDTWTPDHIEKLLDFAQHGCYEFVSAQYESERFGERFVVSGNHADGPYYSHNSRLENLNSPRIGGVSTWFYRSYLAFMRYNPNCWRKKWNKVWDIDLSIRFYEAGVRMGFLPEVMAYVLPRPGEETIGLDAYRLTEKDKLNHFKF